MLLYPASVSVFLMKVLRGRADGGILLEYRSSVDVPFGTSLVKSLERSVGGDVCFIVAHQSESLNLARQTPGIYNRLAKTDTVVTNLILRAAYILSQNLRVY